MKKIYLMVVLMVLFTFPKGLTPFKRNSNGRWRRMLDIDLTEQKWCIDPRDRQKNRGGMARVFRWRQANFKRWEPWPYTWGRGCQFRKTNCRWVSTRSPAMFCPTMGGWLYWKIVRIATTSDRWCYRTRIFWLGTSIARFWLNRGVKPYPPTFRSICLFLENKFRRLYSETINP